MPSTSAACMATETLVPPISAEPSTRFMVPSPLTAMVQLDSDPPFIQKPTATPRPLFGESNGVFQWG